MSAVTIEVMAPLAPSALRCRPASRGRLGALVLFVVLAVTQAGMARADTSAVVVFVHGRGQTEKTIQQARHEFTTAFAEGEQAAFGAEIVPADSIEFVWYADVIDPSLEKLPSEPNCRYFDGAAIGAELSRRIRDGLIQAAIAAGADDFGIRLLAGDTHKYLSKPAVRCEVDSRLEKELGGLRVADRPVVLVAHSMGGLVSFSSLDKNAASVQASPRLRVSHFITLGAQVGHPAVLQALKGSYVALPVPVPSVIQRWTNFQNSGDALAFDTEKSFTATDPARSPMDVSIRQIGNQHSIRTYLANPDVVRTIVNAWCDASAPRPSSCDSQSPSPRPPGGARQIPIDETATVMLASLSPFLGIPEPSVKLTEDPLEPTRVGPQAHPGAARTVFLNTAQLAEYERKLDTGGIDDLLRFSLGHECAHIAQDLRDGTRSLTGAGRECEADLWAAAALMVTNPSPPRAEDAMRRVLSAVALAAEGGELVPAGQRANAARHSHPRVDQRALCAARGINAGLQVLRTRAFARSGDPLIGQQLEEVRQADPEMFDANSDLWAWSLETARRIAEDQLLLAGTPETEFNANMILRLTSAAEEGSDALESSASSVKPALPARCSVQRTPTAVSATCTSPAFPSTTLAWAAFDSFLGVIRPTLLSRGWERSRVDASPIAPREEFAKASASASVHVAEGTRDLIFVVTATSSGLGD